MSFEEDDISIISMPHGQMETSTELRERMVLPDFQITAGRPIVDDASHQALSTAYSDLKKRYNELENRLKLSHRVINDLKRSTAHRASLDLEGSSNNKKLEEENETLRSEISSLHVKMQEVLDARRNLELQETETKASTEELKRKLSVSELENSRLTRQIDFLSLKSSTTTDEQLMRAVTEMESAQEEMKHLKAEVERQKTVIQSLISTSDYGAGVSHWSSVSSVPPVVSPPPRSPEQNRRQFPAYDEHAAATTVIARSPRIQPEPEIITSPRSTTSSSRGQPRIEAAHRRQDIPEYTAPLLPPRSPVRSSQLASELPTRDHTTPRSPELIGPGVASSHNATDVAQSEGSLGTLVDGVYPSPNTVDVVRNRVMLDMNDGQYDVTVAPRTCPMCNEQLLLSSSQFERHVMSCVESHEVRGESQVAPPRAAELDEDERACPVCNQMFGAELPQAEFVQHVQAHFEDPYVVIGS